MNSGTLNQITWLYLSSVKLPFLCEDQEHVSKRRHKDKSMGKTPYLSHSHTCILINRHLQDEDCALAVCQGRTIYPADDVEEKRRRRRAGLLLGMLWVHAQPTACQHFGRCMMDSRGTVVQSRERYSQVYITLNPLSFDLCSFHTIKLSWLGSFLCGEVSNRVTNSIPSNSFQTDLW